MKNVDDIIDHLDGKEWFASTFDIIGRDSYNWVISHDILGWQIKHCDSSLSVCITFAKAMQFIHVQRMRMIGPLGELP